MKNVWLVVLCLLWCAGSIRAGEKGAEDTGGGEKDAGEATAQQAVDYALVNVLIDSKNSPKLGLEMVDELARYEGAVDGGVFLKVIEDRKDADPNSAGFFCQIRLGIVTQSVKRVSLGGNWFCRLSLVIGAADGVMSISKDGKWRKSGGGNFKLNRSVELENQLHWFVCGQLVPVKAARQQTTATEVTLKGVIQNPLPYDIKDVTIIAPLAYQVELCEWKPYMAHAGVIKSGERGEFTVTVPFYVEARVNTDKGPGVFKSTLLWNDVSVASFTVVKETTEAAK